jgi:hypothetical protein
VEHYLRELMTSAFTASQRDALALRQSDQDCTAEAIDQLNRALLAPSCGRDAVWRRNVAEALEALDQAVTTESRSCAEADSLLSDIARTQPRLRNRVRGLRHHYGRLSDQIKHALRMLARGDDVGVADTRIHVGRLISALQLTRGRESDLIYEAYFDAFHRDVEEELLCPAPQSHPRDAAAR